MVEFLQNNLGNMIFIILVLVAIIIAIRLGYIKQIKQGLLYLVCKAEEIYGSGTGTLKYAFVANEIYKLLPSLARLFISVDTIDDLIETAVDEMKKYLSENDKAKAVILENKN